MASSLVPTPSGPSGGQPASPGPLLPSLPPTRPFPFPISTPVVLEDPEGFRLRTAILARFHQLPDQLDHAKLAAQDRREVALREAASQRDKTLITRSPTPTLPSPVDTTIMASLTRLKLHHLVSTVNTKPTSRTLSLPHHIETGQHNEAAGRAMQDLKSPVERLEQLHARQSPWLVAVLALTGVTLALLLATFSEGSIHVVSFGLLALFSLAVILTLPQALGHLRQKRQLHSELRGHGNRFVEAHVNALDALDRWQKKVEADNRRIERHADKEFRLSAEQARLVFQADLTDAHAAYLRDSHEVSTAASAHTIPTGYHDYYWSHPEWTSWSPPKFTTPPQPLRIGWLELASGTRRIGMTALVPVLAARGLLLSYPDHLSGSVENTVATLLFRLLATVPSRALRLTILTPDRVPPAIDQIIRTPGVPASLAGFTIARGDGKIEDALDIAVADATSTYRQYLHGTHRTLTDYHAYRRRRDPPYTLLLALDYPRAFTVGSLSRFLTLAQYGPVCGVHPLILAPERHFTQSPTLFGELTPYVRWLAWQRRHIVWHEPVLEDCTLRADQPPPPSLISAVLNQVAAAAGYVP